MRFKQKYAKKSASTINCENYKQWEMKRKKTTIAFCIQTILLGLDYSLTFLTLWVYLGQLDIENPSQYYGLVAVSYLIVPVFFSVPICQFADHSRNIRLLFFITNTAMIVGNIIYTLSFSPWFLVAGRMIAGCGIPLRSIMAGEVARVYEHEELTSVFSMIGMAFGFGFVAGPGINFAFDSLDTYIGEWHLSYANVSGIYVASFFILSQLMCYSMVYNVSKEYDLKAELQKGNCPQTLFQVDEESNSISLKSYDVMESCEVVTHGSSYGGFEHIVNYSFDISSEDLSVSFKGEEKIPISNNEKTPLISSKWKPDYQNNIYSLPEAEEVSRSKMWILLLKNMMTSKDTTLMLLLAYFENFFSISFNMWLPMAVMSTLQWSMISLNAIVLGTGFCSVLPCILLVFKKFSDREMFWISTVCVGLLACITGVFIIVTFYHTSTTLNIIMWVIYGLCFSNIMIIKDIFLGGFLAKMLSSNVQSLGDSLRLSAQRIGAITALLLSPMLYGYMLYAGFVYIGIVTVLVVLMVLRSKTLSNPQVIITIN